MLAPEVKFLDKALAPMDFPPDRPTAAEQKAWICVDYASGPENFPPLGTGTSERIGRKWKNLTFQVNCKCERNASGILQYPNGLVLRHAIVWDTQPNATSDPYGTGAGQGLVVWRSGSDTANEMTSFRNPLYTKRFRVLAQFDMVIPGGGTTGAGSSLSVPIEHTEYVTLNKISEAINNASGTTWPNIVSGALTLWMVSSDQRNTVGPTHAGTCSYRTRLRYIDV